MTQIQWRNVINKQYKRIEIANMKNKKISFQPHGDFRGQLIAIEQHKNIPFEIKRVYYIYDTLPNVRRGFHAHKTLQQLLVCTSGECKILLDDGENKEVVILNKPTEGLFVEGCIWREMFDFSPGAVLMVLASDYYDESDYIRNYEEFLSYVHKERK